MNRCIVLAAAAALAACSPQAPLPAPPSATPAATPSARTPRASRDATARAPVVAPALARLESLVAPEDTFDSLRARYGDDVVRQTLPGGEGDEIAGWVLYPNDPARRVALYPDEAGTHPASLVVRDAATWRRADGIRLGMTTTELAALNGGPFEFSGFGWDYGGAVMDWKGGRLAHAGRFVGPVTLCEPDPVPEDYPSGDGEFSSDLPVLKAHPAIVCEFGVQVSPAGVD